MTIDVNAVEHSLRSARALRLGHKTAHLISVTVQGQRLLPNPGVEGNRLVLNDDEDLSFLAVISGLSARTVRRVRRTLSPGPNAV